MPWQECQKMAGRLLVKSGVTGSVLHLFGAPHIR
jgi:hypothetical protein